MSEYKNLSIKDWAVEDRPREKYLAHGINSLSNAELIAILIGSGNRDETAVELSKRILASANNNLHELGRLTVSDLKKLKGIGEAKAITIISALELGKRRKISDVLHKDKIQSSQDVADVFQAQLIDLPHEEFWVMLLNRANRIIEKQKISQGGISGTVVDIRLIMKLALEKTASSIILCHNHPSGNPMPSEEDKLLTQKIAKAGKLLEIEVLDHVIIAENKFTSFADEGYL